jgi:hypothetical protein
LREDGKEDKSEFAIKKFKPDREGDTYQYTGISQSACREIAVRALDLLIVFKTDGHARSCAENYSTKM